VVLLAQLFYFDRCLGKGGLLLLFIMILLLSATLYDEL
jgi:hypothetical protein